ncbi:transcriptional regulator FilR1 domain-containing protein [Methanobrevibacter arboriphilus]|nr:transcriptional regulator FilR1 domain-containing protein [Methanobrevibacter arboriphilus]
MAFGLFKEDGTYDQNRLLISDDLDAVKWANGLFDYYNSIGNSLYI